MCMSNKRITLTVVFLLAFAGLIAGLFVAQHLPDNKAALLAEFKGTLLDQPRTVKPFSLKGIDGQTFDNERMKGHWTMVFFGFTSCTSMCPMTMAELGKMFRMLEADKVSSLPEVVMISIDPKRDTLSKLKHYVKGFDSHFFGARGSVKSIRKMTREMGIVYMKVAPLAGESAENYNIQHSGAVMLFNPAGQLTAFFTPPLHADALAADFKRLIN